MAAGNRAELLKQLYKALKKQASAAVPAERTVLEHFIFGTCLEDAGFEAAETAFVALKESLSGWNEVRVSSSTELMEMMPRLPDPRGAAIRVKRILNAVFEERYAFNLDDLRKMNLTAAFTKLEAIPGGTPFSTAYTAQVALGRHGIPVGTGEKKLLYVLGIIDEEDMEKREVTGLNRAITKQQGVEFMALLHAVAADFVLNPHAKKMIAFLKSFAPDYKTRLAPRREVKEENLQETPPLPEVRGSRQYSKKELAEYLKQEIQEEDAGLDPVSNEVPADGAAVAEAETVAAEPEKSGRSRKRKRGSGKSPAAAQAPAAPQAPTPAVKEKKPVEERKTEEKPAVKPATKPAVKPAPKKTVTAPAPASQKKPAPKAPPVAAKKPAVAKKPVAAKKPVPKKPAPVKKAPEKKVAGKLSPAMKSADKKASVKKPAKPPGKTVVKTAVKTPVKAPAKTTAKKTVVAAKKTPVRKTGNVKSPAAAKAPIKKESPRKPVPAKKQPVAVKKAPVKKPVKAAPKNAPKPAVKRPAAPAPVKGKTAKKAPAKKPSSKK